MSAVACSEERRRRAIYRLSNKTSRIHIIGMAGSGKTTLARSLSAVFSAPCYELDAVGYENGAGAKRTIEMRNADLIRIASQPAWITEGAFLWWIEELLRHADMIVWLDLHWLICYQRIVVRHIKADLARSNPHPGFQKMLRFAGNVRPRYLSTIPATPSGPDDDGMNRAAVAQVLTPYMDKVVCCRQPADVTSLIARVMKESI